jgi:hypothetical protein
MDRASLQKGIDYYQIGIDKYLGQCLVERLQNSTFENLEQLRAALATNTDVGQGKWLDLFGMLVPEQVMEEILEAVEEGALNTIGQLAQRLQAVHERYDEYEWAWVVKKLEDVLSKSIDRVSGDDIAGVITKWKESVEALNGLILADARKEFSDFSMIGYGLDGDEQTREADFRMVRGSYDDNSFVGGLEDDTAEMGKVAGDLIAKVSGCD